MEEGLLKMDEYTHSVMTIEEYDSLPENVRVELIDGEVYDMASPSRIHQTLVVKLCNIISNYIEKNDGECEVYVAPFDVKLNDKADKPTIVQPDIFIVCDKSLLDDKRCNGAPDFIIEIVSPTSIQMDYIKKLSLYNDCGVKEYWIVNPISKEVDVYLLEQVTKPFHYNFTDKVKINIYGDLYIDFSKISKLL